MREKMEGGRETARKKQRNREIQKETERKRKRNKK